MEFSPLPTPPELQATPLPLKSHLCHCPPGSELGTVLLFYRYYANNPPLLSEHQTDVLDTDSLAAWHRLLASSLDLTGKLRLAREGFNITIAGTKSSIDAYIDECAKQWSFTNLNLSTSAARHRFFKPTPGCSCVFPSLSVRVCEEITPMAVSNYSPADWSAVRELEPGEWHAMITHAHEDVVLLDMRNHYESSLGYFVTLSGQPAIRPQVRRFSQFPQYVRRRRLEGDLSGNEGGKKKVLSYCTGGIRCEKATRFMQENLPGDMDVEVYTLKGGIAAYMSWADSEIRGGRMGSQESLFKGKNYVFDGRGSIGLEGGVNDVVGRCIRCENPADGIQKCASASCKLELIVCRDCKERGTAVVCCQDCRNLDSKWGLHKVAAKTICQCETDREAKLWGDGGEGVPREQGWKSKRKEIVVNGRQEGIGIVVQMIQPDV